MAKVRLNSVGYGYILEVLDKELLENIQRVVKANGGPDHDTAFISNEDLYNDGDFYPGVSRAIYIAVNSGWAEEFDMDDWYVAAAFGYSAHDELALEGVI